MAKAADFVIAEVE